MLLLLRWLKINSTYKNNNDDDDIKDEGGFDDNDGYDDDGYNNNDNNDSRKEIHCFRNTVTFYIKLTQNDDI